MRVIAFFIVAGLLASCSSQSTLEKQAEAAVSARGDGKIKTHEVAGYRENAVCGTVGTKRFLYRPSMLVIEGQEDWSPVQFEALWRAWDC